MSDRGQHPDLLDDEPASAPEETPSPPRRGRAARAAAAETLPAAAETTTPAAQDSEPARAGVDTSPADAEAAAEPPEWRVKLKEAVEAGDDSAVQALLIKHRSDVVSGHVGQIVRRQREQEAREAIERQKRDALANADFYGLGQLAAPEVQQQLEQAAAAQQSTPSMEGIALFQSRLDPRVQAEIQGKTYGAGKTYAEGLAEYLEAVHNAALRHGREQEREQDIEQELKRREPALRKAWLSEVNGGQPVPELDGGRAASVREITDEQVGRMTLAEYEQYFDEHGQPRPGTRVRLTRGIPLTRR